MVRAHARSYVGFSCRRLEQRYSPCPGYQANAVFNLNTSHRSRRCPPDSLGFSSRAEVKVAEVNFDNLARAYRWLEYASFGPFLQHCRLAHLSETAGARRAIALGDGDGRFLVRMMAENPELCVDAVDSSRAMLDLVEGRISRMGADFRRRLSVHHADAVLWEPSGKYDLAVSHFFFDCFENAELEQILDRIIPHLDRGSRWIVSEFAIPERSAITGLSAAIVGFLYRSFGLLTGLPVRKLPDYEAAMRARGFRLAGGRAYLGGLLQSQLWFLPG